MQGERANPCLNPAIRLNTGREAPLRGGVLGRQTGASNNKPEIGSRHAVGL